MSDPLERVTLRALAILRRAAEPRDWLGGLVDRLRGRLRQALDEAAAALGRDAPPRAPRASPVTDATAGAQARIAARDSDTLMELAAELGGHGFWRWDVAEDRFHCRTGPPQMLTYDDVTLERTLRHVDPADVPRLRDMLARMHSGATDTETIDYGLSLPSEPLIRRRARVRALRDAAGRLTAVLGVVSDMSLWHQLHGQLAGTADRLREILEESPIGIEWYDEDGKLVHANRACLELLGAGDVERVRGLSLFDDPSVPAEQRRRLRAGETVRYEADFDFDEVRARRRFATHRRGTARLQVIAKPVPAARPRGYLVLVQDVTEARRADAERRALEERLQAAHRLESLGLMASGVAHDFNNILGSILMGASLALQELPAHGPVRDIVEEIAASARRAAGLTNQLLAFAGKGRLERIALDLGELVSEMQPMLRTSVPRRICLELEPAPAPLPVRADRSQLQQVVLNLVTNAGEAIGEERSGRVLVTVRAEQGEACLQVSDDGCGMDPEIRPRLFDPFFTTKLTGRGLGLAVVQGIVRSHGGRITVDSGPGAGTVMRVFLPLARSAAPAERPPPREETPARGTAPVTVLLADDDEPLRRVAERMLQRLGHRVLSAASGAEAIELLRDHDGDVGCALLDMTMPGMDGRETAGALRRLRPDLPILFSSGYADVGLDVPPGRGRFLKKPYDLEALGRILGELLGGE